MIQLHYEKANVAVIGAGPAGLYAARYLALGGVNVYLFNRDIKPGGLAEYGIFHSKHRMKEGLRKQFRKIMAGYKVSYFGNVTIGNHADLSLDDLRELGFDAILVTVGAQGTKWLGLPGEDLKGVFHAKDLVYHYNQLPPFSERDYPIGNRVALIGVGNVMVDIAHWAIRDLKIEEVIAIARRGPKEVKFTKKEMQNVVANLDLEGLDREIDRVAVYMEAVDQNPVIAKAFILSALAKAKDPISSTKFRFEFLSSPSRILGNEEGYVTGIEIEDTQLVLRSGISKAQKLGTKRVLDVDTVVFCIGDTVDKDFGLPIEWNEYVKHEEPIYPIKGISYELCDPELKKPIDGIFVGGWSREASSGLVGVAKRDGENGAKALMGYLENRQDKSKNFSTKALYSKLNDMGHPFVNNADYVKIENHEQRIALEQGIDFYKLGSNQEMLRVIAIEREDGLKV